MCGNTVPGVSINCLNMLLAQINEVYQWFECDLQLGPVMFIVYPLQLTVMYIFCLGLFHAICRWCSNSFSWVASSSAVTSAFRQKMCATVPQHGLLATCLILGWDGLWVRQDLADSAFRVLAILALGNLPFCVLGEWLTYCQIAKRVCTFSAKSVCYIEAFLFLRLCILSLTFAFCGDVDRLPRSH